MARRKPKTTISDRLFEALVLCLGHVAERDAAVIESFCIELNIDPAVVIHKIFERCPTFSEMTH
jgi:hypothetical protein